MARQRSRPSRQRSTVRRAGQAVTILAWEDDPGAPDKANTPVSRPVPQLDREPLPVAIRGAKPATKQYKQGTSGFRYWAAAEALRRAADMWAGSVPQGTSWHSTVGRRLTAIL